MRKQNYYKYRWNYCNHMPMLPLLGTNNCLLLLNIDKCSICIEERGKLINEFEIGYIIDKSLHVNKSFKEKAENVMNTIFGELTQPSIKAK